MMQVSCSIDILKLLAGYLANYGLFGYMIGFFVANWIRLCIVKNEKFFGQQHSIHQCYTFSHSCLMEGAVMEQFHSS